MKKLQDFFLQIEKYGVEKNYNSNQFFVRQGEIPRKFAIVKSGLFRYYYLTDEGKEYTKGFISENNVISSYSAMISNSTSYFSIEALEDSIIVEIPYYKWLKMREKNNQWDKWLISILEKGYITKEKRERDLLLLDAETRYLNFLNDYPDLEKRVNLTLIASFLGIQLESLSRIRKKISI